MQNNKKNIAVIPFHYNHLWRTSSNYLSLTGTPLVQPAKELKFRVIL